MGRSAHQDRDGQEENNGTQPAHLHRDRGFDSIDRRCCNWRRRWRLFGRATSQVSVLSDPAPRSGRLLTDDTFRSAGNAVNFADIGTTTVGTTTITITQAAVTVTAAGSSQTLDYNNYAPLSPLSVTNLAFTCPTGNIQGSQNTTAYFKPYCNQNMVNGGDFTSLIAYSITDCIDACLSANLNYRYDKCKGVTFATPLAYMVKNHLGSNCFLKQNSQPLASSPPDFIAYTFKLCTDSSCSSVSI